MKEYQETHPWITFKATDINKFEPKLWMMLGEARVLCDRLITTPIPLYLANELHKVFIAKGVQATTAIEGNTLTEVEVGGILEGTYKAPPSREYQEQEVKNIIAAIDDIVRRLHNVVLSLPPEIDGWDAFDEINSGIGHGKRFRITAELICDLNRKVLEGANLQKVVVPGKIRTHSVIVGGYRGAPARDCDYLLERLADWLESDDFRSSDPHVNFALTLSKAVLAHLYIAWIHPFGDGNGRTARLLESLILARSGLMAFSTTYALWNHYNLTRDRYYQELSSSRESCSASGFLYYSIQGFLDGVREHSRMVYSHHIQESWFAYVHEILDDFPNSPARDRQRLLALKMPFDEPITREKIPRLDPELTALYAVKGPRTLSRDLNRLQKAELIIYHGDQKGWTSSFYTMSKFLLPSMLNLLHQRAEQA